MRMQIFNGQPKRIFGYPLVVIALSITAALKAEAQSLPFSNRQDDIYVQSKVDGPTLNWLLDRTRTVLNNTAGTDYFTDTISLEKDTIFTYDELVKSNGFKDLAKLINSAFKTKIENAQLRLRIPKIFYQVEKARVNPTSVKIEDPFMKLSTYAEVSGISVKMPEDIFMDLMLWNEKTQKHETFLTAKLETPFIGVPKTLPALPFYFDFKLERKQQIEMALDGHNLSLLPGYVAQYQDQFTITAGKNPSPLSIHHITVNPVTVRLNQMSRTFTFDAFKPVVASKIPGLLKMVLNEVGEALQTSIGPSILKGIFNNTLTNTVAINSSLIYTEYNVAKIEAAGSNQLRIAIQGEHCTGELYEKHGKDCVQYEGIRQPVREQTLEDKEQARREIDQKIDSGNADIALSIGEEYFNRLIHTTTKTDVWSKILEEENMQLGPQGAFMLFDKANKDPVLVLDLKYDDKVRLRFPLRISTQMAIVGKQTILENGSPGPLGPYLVVRIGKVLSTTQEIIHGIPAYDLKSKLLPIFKKKIAKMILKMAAKLENTVALELKLDSLQGAGVENMFYELSPYGRLNVYFKSEELD